MAESRYQDSEPQLYTTPTSTESLINAFRRLPKQLSNDVKNATSNLTIRFKNTADDISKQFKTLSNTSEQKVKKYALPAWIDLPITHPLNTITKRLQNSQIPNDAKTTTGRLGYLWDVGFCKSPLSVYNGLTPSMGNKFLARNSKYLFQDALKIKLNANLSPILQPYVGDANSQFLLGSASGFLTSALCTPLLYPIETNKVRKQLKGKKEDIKTAVNNTTPKVSASEGTKFYKKLNIPELAKCANANIAELFNPKNMRSAYNGVMVTTARDIWASSIFFGVNAYCLTGKDQQDQKAKAVAAGIAGMGSAFLANPLDLLKTRKQGSKEPLNLFKVAKGIWKKEGIKGFFKGVRSNLAQAPLRVILPYAAFTYFKDSLQDGNITQPNEVVPINKNNNLTI